MTQIRVLIVDDHALLRSGLRALLEALPDIEVVGEAGDGRQALTLVEDAQPDVVIMDITMPELNGLEATAHIARHHRRARVVVVSMHNDPEWVAEAFRRGAIGFLLKDATSVELELAIRAAARDQKYICPRVASPVIQQYLQNGSLGRDDLTPRQREVLQLVAEGWTSKQIAEKLHIGVKTVEVHRAQIMARLRVHDLPALVRYAVRTGIVSPEI